MKNDQLMDQIIFDFNDPLKIRNISLNDDFAKVKSKETLPGFETPFMSLHEDFSQPPFDIRFRYHNQNGKVVKMVVDFAQFLKKNPTTDMLDNTFNALRDFYNQQLGESSEPNEAGTSEEPLRHKWSGGENGKISIHLDLGYEPNGDKDDDKIKVLKLTVQLT